MTGGPAKPRSTASARLFGRDRDQLIFWGLALLALALRLPRLNQGLWFDEIISAAGFFSAPWKDLLTQMPMPNHHPLYSLLGKLMLAFFGEREWALRLPALVFGVFTPPLLFVFGSRWASRRAGLLAALLMCAAKWPVWFSQDARGYSAMIFFSLLSTHLFLLLNERISRPRLAVYVLSSALAVYSHFYAAAVIGSQLLVAGALAWTKDERGGPPLLVAGLSALAVGLALYAPLASDFYRFVVTEGVLTSGREMNLAFIGRLFIGWAAGPDRVLLSLVLLVPAFWGVIEAGKKYPLVLWTWALPFLAGALTPFLLGTFVFDRFFSYALPGFYLLAAVGLAEAVARLRRGSAPVYALGVGLMLVALLPGLTNYYRHDKQGIRSAHQWVLEHAPDRRTLAAGLVSEVYFYYDRRGPGMVKLVPRGKRLDPAILRRAAVVISHPWSLYDEDYELLKRRCGGGPRRVWPSSGWPEYEVRVYLCD